MKFLVTLVGAVQKEVNLRFTPEARAILNFTVAGTEGKKPWFHQVSVFGKFAEAIAERLKPGTIVAVSGELVQRRWETEAGETRSAINIQADGIRILSAEGHDLIEDASGGMRLAGGVNRVSGYGNLAKAPVMRTTQNGTPVANGTIAVNRVYTSNGAKKEEVSYFDLTAWEDAAPTLASQTKGTGVFITGTLENHSFETQGGGKRYVTRINVNDIFAAEKKLADQGEPVVAAAPASEDEDLPF